MLTTYVVRKEFMASGRRLQIGRTVVEPGWTNLDALVEQGYLAVVEPNGTTGPMTYRIRRAFMAAGSPQTIGTLVVDPPWNNLAALVASGFMTPVSSVRESSGASEGEGAGSGAMKEEARDGRDKSGRRATSR